MSAARLIEASLRSHLVAAHVSPRPDAGLPALLKLAHQHHLLLLENNERGIRPAEPWEGIRALRNAAAHLRLDQPFGDELGAAQSLAVAYLLGQALTTPPRARIERTLPPGVLDEAWARDHINELGSGALFNWLLQRESDQPVPEWLLPHVESVFERAIINGTARTVARAANYAAKHPELQPALAEVTEANILSLIDNLRRSSAGGIERLERWMKAAKLGDVARLVGIFLPAGASPLAEALRTRPPARVAMMVRDWKRHSRTRWNSLSDRRVWPEVLRATWDGWDGDSSVFANRIYLALNCPTNLGAAIARAAPLDGREDWILTHKQLDNILRVMWWWSDPNHASYKAYPDLCRAFLDRVDQATVHDCRRLPFVMAKIGERASALTIAAARIITNKTPVTAEDWRAEVRVLSTLVRFVPGTSDFVAFAAMRLVSEEGPALLRASLCGLLLVQDIAPPVRPLLLRDDVEAEDLDPVSARLALIASAEMNLGDEPTGALRERVAQQPILDSDLGPLDERLEDRLKDCHPRGA